MSLPLLLNDFEDARELAWWLHNNSSEHRQILTAIQQQANIELASYPISSMSPADRSGWLWRHQQMHNDMNAVLGIAGNELSDVDFKQAHQVQAWLALHFEEHLQARQKLGI